GGQYCQYRCNMDTIPSTVMNDVFPLFTSVCSTKETRSQHQQSSLEVDSKSSGRKVVRVRVPPLVFSDFPCFSAVFAAFWAFSANFLRPAKGTVLDLNCLPFPVAGADFGAGIFAFSVPVAFARPPFLSEPNEGQRIDRARNVQQLRIGVDVHR
ncbi:MAG: hypothetical protein R3C28_18385, partial [Pirellulaceae bacterium]